MEKKYVRDYPELAKELHPMNKEAINATHKTNQKVWWKCEKGHEWEARISNRSNGSKCPTCALSPEGSSVAERYPDLAKEWSEKNALSPNEVTAVSSKKIIWKCAEHGVEFEASPADRTYRKRVGCPACKIIWKICDKQVVKQTMHVID